MAPSSAGHKPLLSYCHSHRLLKPSVTGIDRFSYQWDEDNSASSEEGTKAPKKSAKYRLVDVPKALP